MTDEQSLGEAGRCDNAEPKRISAKEFAKKIRKEAYQRMKELRKTDPRQIELKARQKAQRRAASAKAKERGKAHRALRTGQSVYDKSLAKKSFRDEELMAMIMPASSL